MAPELVTLAPGVHFLPAAVNSVVVEDGRGGALLVDTGLDDAQARKLLRALEAAKLTPTAILNTHSHADHHGGNAFLLKRFPELDVFAPPLEAAIINHPVLEPLSLFGARPPRDLQTKFLLAPPSPARPLPGAGRAQLGGVEVELLDVSGHAAQMYAVRMGDVLYAADTLFGPDALAKHPLTFCADSRQQKEAAALLGTLEGVRVVLPGHGDPAEDLAALVEANLAAYDRTTRAVLEAVRAGPASVDELLARVCGLLGVQMTNAGAVVLNRAVVSAHLTELLEAGTVRLAVEDNRLIFGAGSDG
ncbi:MBL fold metallo-hydrolase [Deinococcus metallilatus]|uniref:Glyoxylase-like metal-dependent hydrolase (Beta-lactamase superfamily II) n=1 Tax=Deinococcus metallilatus TaxID=1211322 RepID=A0AAJ5F6C3_9DEIO|nr:MBL fold metallo-hydrolase [Deinococcus metallilatus]MBB5296106.1 glyoxylase-like metal-dependent hydrolase (beta-lactamase superfamily II) [Deinococcus metallilatus]QBY09838.1 MBL fold metallo-hydrolase [Deinococcus metallilatus]RXJ08835.1 MBL fold metallo-hydrolase [Deinococcus metallilatus]TLK23315.1 MBL fold metallo-hydrolase [Deinococcus metallilatus]GMA13972.1 zinc metallohydrolase [Deinococcus metallilatus]